MNNEIENKIDLAVSTAKKVQTETNTMISNERMSRLELEKTIRDNEEAQQHFIHNWREYPHFDKWRMNRPLI